MPPTTAEGFSIMPTSPATLRVLALICGACAAADALAQAAPAKAPTGDELEEIMVTGSLIKRTDTETPSPVQVISADDLKNSGYTTIADVLRNLSSNGQGALNQAFGQAFASGGAGIALRGLTVSGTLTLLDGERMIAYPLSDDNQRSFVDISAIPFNAIEAIDVLKDGGSALYGADAIAGVVNIKLKKTFVGTELTAEAGTSQHQDGTTEHLAGIVGWGDLGSDGHNLYLAVDWHHTDKILASDRHGHFTTLDWSALPGGVNTTPGTVGNNNLTYPDSVTGYLINPNPGNGQPAETFLPGCTQALQAANKCTFQFNGWIQAPSEQTNLLAKYTSRVADDWTATFTGSLFDSIAHQFASTFEPFGHAFATTGYNTGGLTTIPQSPGIPASVLTYPVITLPANSPLNPYGAPAPLVYNFPEVGPYTSDVETTTYRLFADLKGRAGGWDLDGSAGLMYAKMSIKSNGDLEPGALQTALNNGSYVPGQSTDAQALFAPTATLAPSSTLDVINLQGQRELAQLPGGTLAIATGLQYFHKAQNALAPPTVASGVQLGNTAFTVGSQDDTAGFVELQAQPLKSLEVDGAVRYDHYDTYGGSATPKFGFKFKPVDLFAVRGTWGRGFRAPSISESGSSGIATGAGGSYDPVLCPGGVPNVKGTFNSQCAVQWQVVTPANPALKAVSSTNFTFGVIFEPAKAFNASVDYYRIQLNNDIISTFELGGLQEFTSLVRGAAAQQLVCTNTVTTGTCAQALQTTPVGVASYGNYPYVNAAITKTSGVDFDLRGEVEAGAAGTFTARLNYSHMIQYELAFGGNTYDIAGTHGPSGVSGDTGNPKERATASLTWTKGPATATASVNYTGAYKITDPTFGVNCLTAIQFRADGAFGGALSPSVTTLPAAWYPYCSVPHFTDVNLYGAYAASEHVSIHASITNLFNTEPPVDLQTYGGGGELAYNAALHQDGAVGRYFLVGATLRF
jgi:iron complex outermembrane receptor protein